MCTQGSITLLTTFLLFLLPWFTVGHLKDILIILLSIGIFSFPTAKNTPDVWFDQGHEPSDTLIQSLDENIRLRKK